jgi:hypothetical protein
MNTLELNGKKYKLVEIEEEPKPKKTGYERDKCGMYYTVYPAATIMSFTDCTKHDTDIFNKANYYTDKQLAKDNARADTLMRNLRRFSAEGRKQKFLWKYPCEPKYFIMYDHCNERFSVENFSHFQPMSVLFDSRKLAEAAIEKYHDELLWYFTEYQDTAEFREDVQQ